MEDKLDPKALKLTVDYLTLLKDFSENEYNAISYLEKIIGKGKFEKKDLAKMYRTLKSLKKKGLLYISRKEGRKTFHHTSELGIEYIEKISEMKPLPKEQEFTNDDLERLKQYIEKILNSKTTFELRHNLKSLDRFLYTIKNTKWYDATWFDYNDPKQKNLVEFILFLLHNTYYSIIKEENKDREYILSIIKKVFNIPTNKPILLLRLDGRIDANNSSSWFYDYEIEIAKEKKPHINLIDTLIEVFEKETKFKKEILFILSKITDTNGDLPRKIKEFFWDQFIKRDLDECTRLWMYDHLMGRDRTIKDKEYFINKCSEWIKEKKKALTDEDLKKSEILSEEYIRMQDRLL